MKVLQINSCFGCLSTGRIVSEIAQELIATGNECIAAYGLDYVDRGVPTIRIGTRLGIKCSTLYARLFDREGFGSYFATKRFLKKVDAYKPDVVHLHNLHGNYINIKLLLRYLAKHDIPTVLTLHDCWLLTGHCANFIEGQCDKWKTECSHCPRKNLYPRSILLDLSKENHNCKKELLSNIKELSIVCVSKWVADIVAQSHLGNRKISVIHNGVDTEVFFPRKSDFRSRYHLENKTLLLGVASSWGKPKSIDDFCRLSQMLDDNYQIVLVGMTKEQIEELPRQILAIERTSNTQLLAEIYSAADVLLNLTYADTFGLVNAEALACGTPVIAYRTGGVPEIVNDSVGICVEQGDLEAVVCSLRMLMEGNIQREKIVMYARENFDIHLQKCRYVSAYGTFND